MIDGIKLFFVTSDFKNLHPHIEYNYTVNENTGEIKTTHYPNGTMVTKSWAQHRGYNLKLIETRKRNPDRNSYSLTITGSLHKSYFEGRNVENFTKYQMLKEIDSLVKELNLDSEFVVIQNIEIGINLPIDEPAFQMLERKLLYFKGKVFNKYSPDSSGRCLGYHLRQCQNEIKIYDKGLQYCLETPLLRFEVKFKTSYHIRKKIGDTLDLLKRLTKETVQDILLSYWDKVVINELAYKVNEFEQNEVYCKVTNFQYMTTIKFTRPRKYYYLMKQFKQLMKEDGDNTHEKIKKLIIEETNKL